MVIPLHAAAASDGGQGSATPARARMTGPERRKQLIRIGRSLFANCGLDGTTIEEIAATAGVTKPIIYEHFSSKEGLYREVVDQESALLLTVMTEALSRNDDAGPRVVLERAALSLLGYIEDHSDGFRILVRDSPPAAPEGAYSTLLSRIVAQVEHILADEFDRHGFAPEDGSMYAQMLVGMVAMTGQWWLDARSPDKQSVAAHLVNLAWHGLTGMRTDPQLNRH